VGGEAWKKYDVGNKFKVNIDWYLMIIYRYEMIEMFLDDYEVISPHVVEVCFYDKFVIVY
jgi:hypothetical protein